MTNYVSDAVAAFTTKFDVPATPEFRAKLVVEEAREVNEAFAHLLKEMVDLAYVVEGFDQLASGEDFDTQSNRVNRNPEVTTALKLSIAIAQAINNPEAYKDAFFKVHFSNMSKLDNEGNVVRREDGKPMKGPNYRPPDLSDLPGKIAKAL